MTKSDKRSICEWRYDYLAEALPLGKVREFEQHLLSCLDCRRELEDMRIVWEALPADMERYEPPQDLKSHIMQAVRSADSVLLVPESAPRPSRTRTIVRRTALAAAVLLMLAGTAWNYQLYRERTSPAISAGLALGLPVSQLERVVSLDPAGSDDQDAYGLACIVNNGASKQFVVYVFGAQATADEEAYRVWLQQGEHKTAAGDFIVDDSGIGLLTMPILEEQAAFEAVSISFEDIRNSDASKPAFRSAGGSHY
jgi:hypothetical protein